MNNNEPLLFPAETIRTSFVYCFVLPPNLNPVDKSDQDNVSIFFASSKAGFDPATEESTNKDILIETHIELDELSTFFDKSCLSTAATTFIYSPDGSSSLTITVEFKADNGEMLSEDLYHEIGDVARRKDRNGEINDKPTLQSWALDKVFGFLKGCNNEVQLHFGKVEEQIQIERDTFQSPYIISWVRLPKDRPRPWQANKKNDNRGIRQLSCALLRPLHWPIYRGGNDEIRIRSDFFSEGQCTDADLFLHEDGLLLYHPRSILLTTRNRHDDNEGELYKYFEEIAQYAWQDALKIITSTRARWHLYGWLSSSIDEITRKMVSQVNGDASSDALSINELSELREQFILSLNADLLKTHSSTHLIELAYRTEETLRIDQLYMFNMRKFESLNWLMADRLDRMRIEILTSGVIPSGS